MSKNSKYRFKTYEEFRAEGLISIKNVPEGWNLNGEMNKFMGTDVPAISNEACSKGFRINHYGWSFRDTDYVLKRKPFYKIY